MHRRETSVGLYLEDRGLYGLGQGRMVRILGNDVAEKGFRPERRVHDLERVGPLLGHEGDIGQAVGHRREAARREIRIGFVVADIFADRHLGGQRLRIVLELRQLRGGLAGSYGLARDVARL